MGGRREEVLLMVRIAPVILIHVSYTQTSTMTFVSSLSVVICCFDFPVSRCLILVIVFFSLCFLCCTNLIHMVARYFFLEEGTTKILQFFCCPLNLTEPL